VANAVVEQVAAAVLGESPYLSFCDGNTALPDCLFQALHIDSAAPWPTAESAAAATPPEAFPGRTTHLIVNFSPVDVDESNGAMVSTYSNHVTHMRRC